MKKIYKLVSSMFFLMVSISLNAQTWEYLDEAGKGVNGTDTWQASNCDLLVVSDNEVYTAAAYITAFGTNKRIEVYKFDGSTWTLLPLPSSGEDVGNVHVKKSKNSSDIYVAYAKLSFNPYGYFVTLKKYDGSSWSQIGTTLQLPSGGSFFTFELDNNDAPVVFGSAQYSTQVSNVHRYDGSGWVAYPIPNSSGSTFTYNSSFVDDNNNVIFTWTKGVSASLQYMHVDTLSSTGLLATPENVIVPFTSQAFIVNHNNDFSIYNTYTISSTTNGVLKIYDYIGGTWTTVSVDTVSSNAFSPIGKDLNGVNYSGFQSKLYNVSDFNTPLYEPSHSTLLYRLRFSQNYAYILVNNGVVKSELPLTSITDINKIVLIKNNANVYPNPTDGMVNVQTSKSSSSIELYNVIGECLISEKINHLNHIIDISNYPNGVYFLKADEEITKIIKQ
jgi:hypothetical protein